MKLKIRREAHDWCKTHHPGSPINEIGSAQETGGDRVDEAMSARVTCCGRRSAQSECGERLDSPDLRALVRVGLHFQFCAEFPPAIDIVFATAARRS